MNEINVNQRLKAQSWQPWRHALLAAIAGCANLVLLSNAAIAQITEAIVTEIVDGDEVFIDRAQDTVSATVDMAVNFQETIRTEDARAALRFDNGAAGRLGEDSQIVVGQCIEVQQGILLASGPANGCTANFSVAVQGTIYTLEVDESGTHNVQVLEGEVNITLNAPTPETAPLSPFEALWPLENPNLETVKAGELLEITPEGRFGPKRVLSEKEILRILNGGLFDDFANPLLGIDKLQTVLNNLYPGVKLPGLPGFEPPRPPVPSLPGPRPRRPF